MKIALRVAAGLACALAVWLVSFGCSAHELPEVTAELDDPMAGDPGTVYLVEVQARPDYRVVAYDPTSATATPLFVIPEFGALASLTASPEADRLILSYTKDYRDTGTGLYALDLEALGDEPITDDAELAEIAPTRIDLVYDDLQLDADGTTLWATLEEPDRSAVVSVDVVTGQITRRVDGAVEPAVGDGWVAYLVVEADESRRSVAVLDLETGETTVFEVLDGAFDLGHLLADAERNRLLLTALYPEDQPAIQIGAPAEAHGAHDGPSQWLTLDVETGEVFQLAEHEPMTVRDAALLANGAVAASGIEGVATVQGDGELLLESRYITEMAS